MAASLPPEFSYTPLPPGNIRLLEITTERGRLPGSLNQHNLFDDQDVVVLQIHVADLNEPPLYDALSYTWGNPLSAFESKSDWEQAEKRYSSKVPILCGGKLLYIGFSLHEALTGLRRTARDHHDLAVTSEDLSSPRLGPRPLVRNRIWIDAVCIDQSHLEERSTQVKMMHLIYKRADAVLIWLGPQDEVARQAVRAMLNLSMAPKLAAQTLHLSEKDRSTVFKAARSLPIHEFAWYCIVSLLQRRWFRRAWIIQEVAWARIPVVVCDHRLWIDWHVLLFVSDWMVENGKDRDVWLKPWIKRSSAYFKPPGYSGKSLGDLITRTIRSMGNIHREVRTDSPTLTVKEGVKKSSLLELLVLFWESECSVPHEKVYALFSLCQDQPLIDSIPVDYSKSVAEVYTETARGMLRSMGQLDLLSYSSVNVLSKRLHLPSWVPDWSKKPDSMPIGHDQWLEGAEPDYDMVFPFCADGNTGDWTAPVWAGRSFNPSSGRRLIVQGKRVASIKTVAPLNMDEPDSMVHVLNEIPSRYSYFKSVPLQPYGGRVASEDDPSATRCREDQLPKAALKDTTTSKEAELKQNHQAWARSDETRSEALWRTVVADIWKGCHPAPDEAGLAFVRFLASELGRAVKELDSWNKRATGAMANCSRLQLERKRDSLEALLRFLSEDEQRCLDEYYKRSREDSQPDDLPQDWLVTQPRQYLPHIEPSSDISDFIASLHVRDDKDLLRYHGHLSGSRLLFSTEDHKLGLGPVSARCGDEIWILNGAKCPSEVVGAAYVHGIMHGQEVGFARGVALPFPVENIDSPDIVLE
jgi:hypothetical protein